MKILVVSNYYPPLELGGWEQLTRDVVNLLVMRGHQVHVLTSTYRFNELTVLEQNVSRVLNLESPDHIRYHPLYSLKCRKWEVENVNNLEALSDKFKPDIIFINGMWNLPVSLARRAEHICPGRVVYYVASLWPIEVDAHTAYWTDYRSGNWRSYLKRLISPVIRKTLIDGTPRNQLDFHLVLCVSAFIRDLLINEAGIPVEKLRVVHNGIEHDQFVMRELQYSSHCLKLLYVGRLSPDKGVHTAIEGFGIFRQRYPAHRSNLTIIGGGAPDYEKSLRQLVEDFRLGDHVTFSGWVGRDQISGIMQNHDVLVFPSIWSEPLARVVQEAMACGLIVIGTSTGGTPEILVDGQNGLSFIAENAQMLADKISLIAEDDRLKTNLAQAARKTIEEKFTLDRMVGELEENFSHMIQTTGRC